MIYNTLQVLEGSVLKFRIKVNNIDVTNFKYLDFENELQYGLDIDIYNSWQDIIVSYYASSNNANTYYLYYLDWDFDLPFDHLPNENYLVRIRPEGITKIINNVGKNVSVNIIIEFKAKIFNLYLFLYANYDSDYPDDPDTLSNICTVIARESKSNTLGNDIYILLKNIPIEEYHLEVCGYSITVSPNKKGFNAKFCFNIPHGEYPNGQYILTIKPTDGILFPTDDELKDINTPPIKAYRGCYECEENKFSVTSPEINTDGNLKITIKDSDIQSIANHNSYNDCILVSVHYKLSDEYYSCSTKAKENLVIQGSMKLVNKSYVAELKNFILYVNIDSCNSIVGTSNKIS